MYESTVDVSERINLQKEEIQNIKLLDASVDIKKIKFKRQDLSDYYDLLSDTLFDLKIYELFRFEETENEKILFLMNYYKIVFLNNTVATYRFNVISKVWDDITYKDLPHLPLLPFSQASNAWQYLVFNVVWTIAKQLGYEDLKNAYQIPDCPTNITKNTVVNILISKIFKTSGKYFTNYIKGFRSVFFNKIVDRDLLKAVLAVNFPKVTFMDYLKYLKYSENVKRLREHHSNLMPVLFYVNQERLGDQNIFAKYNWVSAEKRIDCFQDKLNIEPFDARTYNYFRKLPHPVIARWIFDSRKPQIIYILAKATINITDRIPVRLLTHLVYVFNSSRITDANFPLLVQVYRIYIEYISRLWKDTDFKTVLTQIKNSQFSDVLDWFYSVGAEQNYPLKNSTWNSILKKSNDWHEDSWISSIDVNKTWDCILDPVVIDQAKITPLNDSYALMQNGRVMHHCIFNYESVCNSGDYIPFAVEDKNGFLSTLGIYVNSDQLGGKKRFRIDQHRSYNNGGITPHAKSIEKKFLILLIDAYEKSLIKEVA